MNKQNFIKFLHEVGRDDVFIVGGKNASLGEMIRGLSSSGVQVPNGFATTVDAYRYFLEGSGLTEKMVSLFNSFQEGLINLEYTGKTVRNFFLTSDFPDDLADAIRKAYKNLCRLSGESALDVAVRSSATAEDQPEASFAGMLDSYLNVRGEKELLEACRRCFSSLFTDRAIIYREEMGLDHMDVALCVGIQRMVRSDKGGAGVMFSIDKDTGFPDMVVITAAWGLGESVAQGAVIPDEYRVYKLLLGGMSKPPILEKVLGDKGKKCVYEKGGGTKDIATTREERSRFVLNDTEILTLGKWAADIETHYRRPMDIEWAKDGISGDLFVVQARPVSAGFKRDDALSFYRLEERGRRLCTGISIGEGIASGKVSLIESDREIHKLSEASILVSENANTGWVSDLKENQLKALVTDFGGRNSHAAILCRELGIPGVVATRDATEILKDGQQITVQSIEGDHGHVYSGVVDCGETKYNLRDLPYTKTDVMLNVASDAAAYQWWRLPCRGIGLVRMDYILQNIIKIHPMALARFETVTDIRTKYRIEALTEGYSSKEDYFIDRFSSCLAKIAASRAPEPVIVRVNNLEPDEMGKLVGGELFEKAVTVNEPGFKGVARYRSELYRPAFNLEREAFRRVRQDMGFTNLHFMIPHCQHLRDAEEILNILADNDIRRGNKGLRIYLCCDFASNLALAEDFAHLFDGFSLDIRKLPRWIETGESILKDRFPSGTKAEISMRKALEHMRDACHRQGGSFTVRGRLFVDAASLISLLVDVEVDAISVNPEALPRVMQWIVDAEKGKSI